MSSHFRQYKKVIFPHLAINWTKDSIMITNANGEAIRTERIMVALAFPELSGVLDIPNILGERVILAPDAPYASLVALGRSGQEEVVEEGGGDSEYE